MAAIGGLDRRRGSISAGPTSSPLGGVRARLLCGASSLSLPRASAALVLGVALSGIALSGEARAQSSYNGTRTTTYTLTTPGKTSPFTFGSAANVTTPGGSGNDAVVGDTGTSWNVINNGKLYGDQRGIYLQTPGGGNSVTNAGQIKGTTSAGVQFAAGGSVTNQTGALISSAQQNGVYMSGGVGTVTNAGTITTTFTNGYGVKLLAGGSVTNQTGGTITGGSNRVGVDIQGVGSVTNQVGATITAGQEAVRINFGAGTVINAGTITATIGTGIDLRFGGSVTNQAGGTITGNFEGVSVRAAGTVTNSGTIAGTGVGAYGVYLKAGGSVTNQAGGLITGDANGVYLKAGGSVTNLAGATITGGTLYGGIYVKSGSATVTNGGTITGTGGGWAVKFAGTGANTLILQPGSVINGLVLGSTAGGATNAFQLGGPTGAGSFDVTSIGVQYQNFTTFSKVDISTWTLTGTGNQNWSVQGGTLIAGSNGLTGAFTVSGGVLGGGGTIGSLMVNGGGTVAPGAASPFTTLNVSGNAIFASGASASFYRVNLNAAGQADKLAIGGTAALTGGIVQTIFAPGSYTARSYTILHATGGLGGSTFNGVSGNLPGFSENLSYTSTDVLLNLIAVLGQQPQLQPLPGGGLSGNQRNVANAINSFFNSGGTLPPGFLALFGLSGANLANALSQNSGEAATGAQQVAFQMMTGFLNIMIDPSIDGRDEFGGGGATPFAAERTALPEDIALAYGAALKAPPPGFEQRWSAWGSAFGGVNHTNGDPVVVGSHDLAANAAGVAAGFDYHLTRDTLIGFALAGGGTSWSLAQGLGGGRSDAVQAGLYAKTHNGPAYLAASLAFAEHWMSTDRLAFAGDHLTSRFNAESYGGRIEGGYRFATDFVGVTPYAAAQVQSFYTPGYSKTDLTGGGFGLAFAARNATDTRSELGSRFDNQLVVNPDAVLVLRGRAAWAHDWVSNPTLMSTFQALPGASFIVNGATPAKDSALASAGAELRWRSGWSLAAKFDGEFASRSQTYAGTGTVRYSW